MDKLVANSAEATLGGRSSWLRSLSVMTVGVSVCILVVFVWARPLEGLAEAFLDRLAANRTDVPSTRVDPATLPFGRPVGTSFTLKDLDNHPDRLHSALFSAPFYSLKHSPIESELVAPFRDLLNIYVMRQAVDDNFTIRVIDSRTNSLLERYTLEEERTQFYAGPDTDWKLVDQLRAAVSNRLVAKYRRKGIPNDAIVVKWGRVDQIYDARRREAGFIEYEIKLSRMLGLSLLSTEIGTVETFNDDRLVSSVGARGRYQMMPYLLRKNGIYSYALQTDRGAPVQIWEEWHPMLTMEPAFILMKGYSNAVGHEIPGISAYHTGPFNIYKIYQKYLNDPSTRYTPSSTVLDAYMWALTEGYDQVSEDTGFRTYSRTYVPSAYGALRSTESTPIDTSLTLRMERVQLADDASVTLAELIEALACLDGEVEWGAAAADTSVYNRFRTLNPHFDLPDAAAGERVPAAGNARLTAWHANGPVRFFLPLGASSRLEANGLAVFDPSRVFRFDREAFWLSDPTEVTVWDQQYQALVDDIGHFGFTTENMTQLELLTRRFETLAEEHPTYYRQIQHAIISLHLSLWKTGFWRELSTSAQVASRRFHEDVQPGQPMGLTQRMVFAADQAPSMP
ncbi:MAG: hypothetical protein R2834_12590 [Rhodothermales bacterium]